MTKTVVDNFAAGTDAVSGGMDLLAARIHGRVCAGGTRAGRTAHPPRAWSSSLYFNSVVSGNAYTAFDGNAMLSGYDPVLSAGTLHAGKSTRGNVIFDVPTPHGGLQVTDPLGAVVGEWNV